MTKPEQVGFAAQSLDRFRPMVGDAEFARMREAAERAREAFSGRAIWHVSSTSRGGGVAEMLHALLPYVRGAGVDTRWVVLHESPEFFALTKRLHNHLHGFDGDARGLGEEDRQTYESALAHSAGELTPLLREGDVVFLHDPQPLGLAPAAKAAGAAVIWRCHIGSDRPNEIVTRTWDFLAPYALAADAFAFTRNEYVWSLLDRAKVWIMPPSIDPFSPKNQELEPDTVAAILAEIGLCPRRNRAPATFTRSDGTPSRVERPAEILQEGELPDSEPMVLQVSRWDRLKDHRGVMESFDRHLSGDNVHLVLAGPASGAVSDDPEGGAVWAEIASAWPGLAETTRRRLHLVTLPMADLDENGAMVNALQRRADVVVQKSLAEGFGLTVAEAMWKSRPVVASRVGGIQDQIVDGESGLLVDDPLDLESFAAAISSLLEDPARAERIGQRARQRVMDRFLGAGRLVEYVELVSAVVGGGAQLSISP